MNLDYPLVDFHCHMVPEVDDGAPDLAAALRYLAQFVELGITRVVTTPHLATMDVAGPRRARIEERYAELQAAVAERIPLLSLGLSYEIRLDDPDDDLTDPRIGLEAGGHMLVEFPMLMLPAYPDRMLEAPRSQGWIPVLAHPERYMGVEQAFGWVQKWRDAGTLMCLNAGSLWGEYGPEAERVSRRMLAEGLVDIIASDHHARPTRATTVYDAWHLLAEAGFEEQARTLCSSNPLAVLRGEPCAPVAACAIGTGWFGRMLRLVRGG